MHMYWYFDFISPFAYLQLARIKTLRQQINIIPKPILFAAVLKHCGQLGPAEIPAKRAFTYRFVRWQAEHSNIELRFPPAHPFNPIAALRLSIATGTSWEAIEAIFSHLWQEGRGGETAEQLAGLGTRLGIDDITTAIAAPAVKDTLRANTDQAIAAGVFGVPTLSIGNELFWGNDATAMFEEYLANPECFETPEYQRITKLPVGTERRVS